MKHIFGTVPSRRLGESLGISPIPDSTCNFSCTYCQLGRTHHMTNKREMFYPVNEIVEEFKEYLKTSHKFDVVSIVGEGEPTLYAGLGELIVELKKLTDKPITIITNSALMADPKVREELLNADIILPSLDGYNEESFKKIDRPHGSIDFNAVNQGLVEFSKEFKGQLWVEIMLIDGVNTTPAAIAAFKEQLKEISYDRLFINSPVRPPAEKEITPISHEKLEEISKELGGINIDTLASGSFDSDIPDDIEAIVSICARHPMNNFEISSFLSSRGLDNEEIKACFEKLEARPDISSIEYKGITTYRVGKE